MEGQKVNLQKTGKDIFDVMMPSGGRESAESIFVRTMQKSVTDKLLPTTTTKSIKTTVKKKNGKQGRNISKSRLQFLMQ